MAHQKMCVQLLAIFILQIAIIYHMLEFLSIYIYIYIFLFTFLIILLFCASISLVYVILEPEALILPLLHRL
jgi:hypothetical protein